jgi:hypothetical protein
MSRLQRFKSFVWRSVQAVSPDLERQLRRRFSRSYHENWGYRTRQARACPDNAFIPRVPNAGMIVDGYQIMHNGLKVVLGSYYGEGPIRLLQKNKGVHEPQEERIFQEVLKTLAPGSVIVELGAYWGFYSMWFCRQVPQGRAYMVEPMAENMAYGEKNFAANGLKGHFTQAYVGKEPGVAEDGTRIIGVDDFLDKQAIEHVTILHSDIQGFEVEMLQGCARSIRQGRISWFFVSTHNEELHAACEQFFKENGFVIEASVTPAQCYSTDGVLVARAPGVTGIPPLSLSRRTKQGW